LAKKPPVHVEPGEKGWAVIREGSERASSRHPTQAEAVKVGRDTARREETEFFLHARDGRVREHRSYAEGPRSVQEEEVVVGQATEPVSGATSDATSGEATSGTKEARDLTDAKYDDRFGTPGERYAGYEVYDRDGERIGKPDALFVDENDDLEYLGVRTGPSGTGSILIPAGVVAVDDRLRRMVVSRPKDLVESGPSLGYDEEVTPEREERVRRHYGLAIPRDAESKRGYGAYYRDDAERERGGSSSEVPGAQTVPSEAGVLEDEDELRVRRSEEELRIETREREAGAVRVRKRVRTDRERIRVPKKRMEVTVERVPVEREAVSTEGEAPRPEIGDDEIVVPVIEEEVVVEKRPVVKEEIRIRKKVVEDTEVVEEDVRREEVEVDDETGRRDPAGGARPT
jgi:uncharacterized protein (TIGR02271 family)